MALISFLDVSIAFGGPLVLDKLSFQLEAGERVALLGRNGVGKSTLMRVMTGEVEPASGIVSLQKGATVAFLPQDVPKDITGLVFDVILGGLGERAGLLTEYHHVTHRLHTDTSDEVLQELDRLQGEIDRTGAWELDRMVEEVISTMGLDGDADFAALSGGQKRRVMLARALVMRPDVLLLDEPTNHLDIDSINALEKQLKDFPGTVFFVTHDRTFMDHVATRIVELDRGKIISWSCDYKTFLERKGLFLTMEAVRQAKFDKKLDEEEGWIRQGVQARRCRNEGRVRALLDMRAARQARRQADGTARMKIQDGGTSGHLVIKASRLGCTYDERTLINDLSINIMRGDKIGLIGPNGCGKSTLLRILLGKQAPTKGTVRFGTELQIVYFDQLRETLDLEKTVAENICGASESIIINGKPRHIISYLEDFLFTADRARSPVKILSGGERNRLLLARLFTRPANLLVMDEPTNDLDIETLEVLEDLLVRFDGTLLLASHDRTFLDNVVTSTIAFEGKGEVNEYPGGYNDWLVQKESSMAPAVQVETPARKAPAASKPVAGRKLSFKEQKELSGMPDRIASLENEQEDLCAQLADPQFYQRPAEEITGVRVRSEQLALEIQSSYRRWEELEKLDGGS